MKALVLILLSCLSISLATANQDNNAQKLQLQKKFLSTINQCSNPQVLDQFFKNAVKNASDQNERAKHAALLEELIKYNPSCFVASVKKLDNETCEKIEESYLNEPFFYPRDDLRASLSSVKGYKSSCLAS
jgi:3-methyladenine DNA glycosylase AlkD